MWPCRILFVAVFAIKELCASDTLGSTALTGLSGLSEGESFSCRDEALTGSDEKVFEGVEKRIEIRFRVPEGNQAGLRAVNRGRLDEICEASKCTIIHAEPDRCFDSYILSESSLFVFRDRIMIKTCGTTRPLSGVSLILQAAREVDLSPLEMTYSRSSFVFPDLQLFPHDSLDNEKTYLDDLFEGSEDVMTSETYILGKLDDSYWLVHKKIFNSEDRGVEVIAAPRQIMLDCIMTGLSSDVCESYWKDADASAMVDHGADMSGPVESLIDNFRVIGKAFDPCGFSANVHSLENEDYLTVHVTPEEAFSYASVEGSFSGINLDRDKLGTFLQNVADRFQPRQLLVTVLSRGPDDMVDVARDLSSRLGAYRSSEMSFFSLSGDTTAASIVFVLEE